MSEEIPPIMSRAVAILLILIGALSGAAMGIVSTNCDDCGNCFPLDEAYVACEYAGGVLVPDTTGSQGGTKMWVCFHGKYMIWAVRAC